MNRKWAHLRLFVTGIGKDCTAKELWYYLSNIVDLVLIAEHQMAYSASKGYIVTTADKLSFDLLLFGGQLIFQGRMLHCQPFFESANQLKVFNMHMNSRRVLLKRVPICIAQQLLSQILEQIAGPLEKLFAYQSDTTQNNPGIIRRFKTYSALFKDQASAEILIRMQVVQLKVGTKPAIIEKYNFEVIKQRVQKNDSRCTLQQCSIPTAGTLQPFCNSSSLEIPKKTGSHVISQKSSLVLQNNRVWLTSNDPLKYHRIDINAKIHSVKPTSIKYFEMNKKFRRQSESGLLIRLPIHRSQTRDQGH